MKNFIFVISILLTFSTHAQIKVGSNPTSISTNTYLEVESTNSNRFVVTKDSSKVGIGTLTPTAQLEVVGKVKISDGTQGTGKLFSSNTSGVGSWVSANSVVSEPWYSTASNVGATSNSDNIYQNGNVGIKDNNPTSTLDVNGSMAVKYSGISATSYTITNQDYYLLYNGTANATFTLPAGTVSTCNCTGRVYEIINSSNFNIVLNANASEQVGNLSSSTIAPHQTLKLVNNGAASGNTWSVVNYGSQETLGTIPTQVLSCNVDGTQNVMNGNFVLSLPIENLDSYNAWSGTEYTVPVTGTYQITFQSLNGHTSGGSIWYIGTNIEVYRASSWQTLMGDVRSGLEPSDVANSTSVTVSTKLTQGEKIRLFSFCNSTTNNIVQLGSLVITKF